MFVANTANGKSVANSDNEPINDAVSRHIRPQIVHDISRDARCSGPTNSPVLDTITTSVMLTTDFSVRLSTIMAVGCSCTASKKSTKEWRSVAEQLDVTAVVSLTLRGSKKHAYGGKAHDDI